MTTDIQRRNAVLSALALVSILVPAVKASPVQISSIDIEAPEDVFVEKMRARSGPIKAGDPLFSLKSYVLLQMQSHLDMLSSHIDIANRPFIDGRIDQQIQLISDQADNLREENDMAQKEAGTALAGYKVGATTIEVYWEAVRMADQVKSEYLKTSLAKDQAASKLKDAQDKIALAKERVVEQKSLLNELLAKMQVSSSVSGTFSPLVAEGSFVKRGHLLGRITA